MPTTHTCLSSYCYRSHRAHPAMAYSQRHTGEMPDSVRYAVDADRKMKEGLLAEARRVYEDAPRRIASLEKTIEELNAFLGRS